MTVLFMILFALQPGQDPLEALRAEITARFEASPGTYALAFTDISNPRNQLYIYADTVFHAASTMKTPVMIEAYKQAAAGRFSLDDSLLIHNSFRSIVDGSAFGLDVTRDGGEAFYEKIGQKLTIREVIYEMITVSGNLATNIMIDLVDAHAVTRTMRELGAARIEVLRGVEDMKAFEAGLSNRTTARDLAVIFGHLARGTAVSAAASAEMTEILKDQKYRDVIPAGLPEGTAVANKTGSINRVVHDSAIVYLPDGRSYVLIFLSKDLDDNATGTQVGADVSRLIHAFMTAQNR